MAVNAISPKSQGATEKSHQPNGTQAGSWKPYFQSHSRSRGLKRTQGNSTRDVPKLRWSLCPGQGQSR